MSQQTDLDIDRIDDLDFEKAYELLEDTVGRLEAGELALSDLIQLYEQGIYLARRCTAVLDTAELQVQQLSAAPPSEEARLL